MTPLAVDRACGLNNFLRVAYSFAVIHFFPAKCKLAPGSTIISLCRLAIKADTGGLPWILDYTFYRCLVFICWA